jgi:hypothetical protein
VIVLRRIAAPLAVVEKREIGNSRRYDQAESERGDYVLQDFFECFHRVYESEFSRFDLSRQLPG